MKESHPACMTCIVLPVIFWCVVAARSLAAPADGAPSDATKPPSIKQLLTRVQPRSPDEALKSFRIEAGFRIELAAAEPQVVDPIAAAFDERGRLYVAEMRGYPFPPGEGRRPQGRVRLLEDRDGDGRFEHSTLFADELQWPSGIAVFRGGIYVAAPPKVHYLKDTNGDGRADLKKVLFDGFGTGASEDIMNNLKWGLDNRIYGACSYNGGHVRRPEVAEFQPIPVRSSSFRFDPVTLEFERLPGTGDFGNCFDDYGNRFVSNAGNLLMHAVFPGPYLDRNPYFRPDDVLHKCSQSKRRMHSISRAESWRVVRQRFWHRFVNTTHQMRASRFSEQELAVGGWVTGGAAAAIYRGDVFPESHRGNSFTAEPAGNVVIRLKLAPAGVTFDARETNPKAEFLASTDNWFRPVNVLNGPDGALYVLDMYRELIEDPSAIPKPILKHMDVTNGRNRGRIYRIVPKDFRLPRTPKLHEATTDRLVAQLASENAWSRETAQRLLIERQDRNAVGPLRKLLREAKSAKTRIHALWTLHGLAAADRETLRAAMRNPDPRVRIHVLRVAEGSWLRPRYLETLVRLSRDSDPRVRFQAALSAGTVGPRNYVRVAPLLAEIARRDVGDPWIRAAVMSSVGEDPADMFGRLMSFRRFPANMAGRQMLLVLAEQVGAQGSPPRVMSMLHTTLRENPDLDFDARAEFVLRVAAGLRQNGASLRPIVAEGRPWLRERFDAYLAEAAKRVADEDLSPPQRGAAARLLALEEAATAVKLLGPLLTAVEPVELQVAAATAVSRLPGATAGELLIDRWRALSPAVRREAADALLQRKDRIERLLVAIEQKRIRPLDLEPAQRATLLKHPDKEVRRRAERLLGASAATPRDEVLKAYSRALLLEGDARRAAIFKKHCAACHRLGDVGHQIGPDLTTVSGKPAEELLLHILAPNRQVAPKFVSYVAITLDGRTITGMVAEETATHIMLQRSGGERDVVPRAKLEELVSTGKSIMPEGFEKQIKIEQMADLLRFLLRFLQSGGKDAGAATSP